ncbi:MAG: hypothetical protein HOV94_09340 [Saccharothrix sp.]|nr:hypothetical protein [Saccharothrix sp.]
MTENVNQHGQATGHGQVIQAGRDLHVHHGGTRRVVPRGTAQECPYPGLVAFTAEQAHWYFGRDDEIAELVERLARRLDGGGVQAVVAPSGAGKSSLLRAGLLPRLAASVFPGSADWPVVVCSPTADPAEVSSGWSGDGRRVVVVDQFEELFTLCDDVAERAAFITALTELSRTEALVVVGIRADFYAACADHPDSLAWLQDDPLVLGPLDERRLREAIQLPAETAGLSMEDGLVERLLRDLGGGNGGSYPAGRLPLLAHALRAGWRHRSGATLTVAGYEQAGGIRRAVARSADLTMAAFHDDEDLVRTMFLRLVHVGHGTEDVRRRRSTDDLLQELPARSADIVAAFTEARLLVRDRDQVEITHEALIEAWPRLRGWIDKDRIAAVTAQDLDDVASSWNGEDRSVLYRGARLSRVRHDVREHALSPRAEEFLAASTRLDRTTRVAKRTTAAVVVALLVALGVVYVDNRDQQSRADFQAQLARTATANQAATKADELRTRDPSLALALAQAAYRLDPTSVGARSSLLAAAGTTHDMRLVDVATTRPGSVAYDDAGRLYAVRPDGTVQRWLPGAVRGEVVVEGAGSRSSAGRLAVDAAGDTVAFAVAEDTIAVHRLDDRRGPAATVTLPGSTVTSLALDPKGHRMVVGSNHNETRLFDLATDGTAVMSARWTNSGHPLPEPVEALGADLDHVRAVAFSPDGSLLAIASSGTDVDLRAVDDPTRPTDVLESADRVRDLAFTRDGSTLTVLREHLLETWDVTDRTDARRRQPTGTSKTTLTHLAADPDRDVIVVSDETGRLLRLDGSSLQRTGEFPRTAATAALAIAPDGGEVVSVSADGVAHRWPLSTFSPAPRDVDKVAVSHDGTLVALLSGTTIDLVRPAGPGPWGRAEALGRVEVEATDSARDLVLSRDGTFLAMVTSTTGDVAVWDVHDPSRPVGRVTLPHVTGAQAGFLDGHLLVTVDTSPGLDHLRLHVWDPTRADPATPVGSWEADTPNGEQVMFPTLSVSPDGGLAAIRPALKGWQPILVDVSHPDAPREVGRIPVESGHAVADLVFDGRGEAILTTNVDGTFHTDLVDIGNPAAPRRIDSPLAEPAALLSAFSPSGRMLALVTSDDTIIIRTTAADTWRATRPGTPLALLTSRDNRVTDLAFAADDVLVSRHGDGTVRVWPTDPDAAADHACATADISQFDREWARHVPGQPYEPPCPPR